MNANSWQPIADQFVEAGFKVRHVEVPESQPREWIVEASKDGARIIVQRQSLHGAYLEAQFQVFEQFPEFPVGQLPENEKLAISIHAKLNALFNAFMFCQNDEDEMQCMADLAETIELAELLKDRMIRTRTEDGKC